jgi:hypothetical protein
MNKVSNIFNCFLTSDSVAWPTSAQNGFIVDNLGEFETELEMFNGQIWLFDQNPW